jgi:hypothetical protein
MDIQNFPPLAIQAFEIEPGDTILDYCGTQTVVVACQDAFKFDSDQERDEQGVRLADLLAYTNSQEKAVFVWRAGLRANQQLTQARIVPLSIGRPVEVVFPANLVMTVRRVGGAR